MGGIVKGGSLGRKGGREWSEGREGRSGGREEGREDQC